MFSLFCAPGAGVNSAETETMGTPLRVETEGPAPGSVLRPRSSPHGAPGPSLGHHPSPCRRQPRARASRLPPRIPAPCARAALSACHRGPSSLQEELPVPAAWVGEPARPGPGIAQPLLLRLALLAACSQPAIPRRATSRSRLIAGRRAALGVQGVGMCFPCIPLGFRPSDLLGKCVLLLCRLCSPLGLRRFCKTPSTVGARDAASPSTAAERKGTLAQRPCRTDGCVLQGRERLDLGSSCAPFEALRRV